MPEPSFWVLVFGVAFVVQIVYWGLLRHGFLRAQREAFPGVERPVPPMTVVVAARDEARRLPTLLSALTRQTHPHYEIILVDDASVDATVAILRTWQDDHPLLRVVSVVQPEEPRKKRALTQGIDGAAYPLLALTDADCAPPPGWLMVLAQRHARMPGEKLLIGYSPFRKAPGLLNRLARYETFVTGFLTAATVGLGRPYMAVGRNLSYSQALFEHVEGFTPILHALSGDDDLFVQHVFRHRAASIHHLFDPRTFVPSEAPATWRAWFRQKRRHLSAGRFYDREVQVHLALFQGTSIALWLAPLALGWLGAGLLGTKLLAQHLILHRAAHALHERDLLATQPFLEVLYVAYNLLLAPLGLTRLPRRW